MDKNVQKIRLHISGMACVNCRNKIEKKLNHTEGIISASVSYNDGTADIAYDEEIISLKKCIDIIEHIGYKVINDKASECDIVNIVCMLAIIISLYAMLQSAGILSLLVPGKLADTKMGYRMIFVIGLITSVHCIAMCGGISLSQCIPQKSRKSENGVRVSTFCLALSYNLGRVLSYTATGFVLGLIGFVIGGGEKIWGASILQGILKIIAGLFMVIMGVNMLEIFPWLRKFAIRMPRFPVREISMERVRIRRPFLVGILNGFMPCGPLQSMWIVALASGNPFSGALSMFLFCMGTVPLMLGLGFIVSAFSKKYSDQAMTVGGVLIVVLGLAMLSQGGSLSGWIPPDLLLILVIAFGIAGVLLSIPFKRKIIKKVAGAVSLAIVIGFCALWNFQGTWGQKNLTANMGEEIADGVQIVNSTLSSDSYPDITVQAGIPVKWVIDAPEGSINGCNGKTIIQEYGIEYTFKTGENIIEFTPTEAGTVSYSCWMGMIYGNIFVTNGPESNIAVSNDNASAVIVESEQKVTDMVAAEEGEALIIPVADVTTEASFFPVEVNGTKMEVIAVKDSEGDVRTAFNTCQVCYDSGRGYYIQSGNNLVCQNCGNRFSMEQVGIESGGCNPWPIFDENKNVTDDKISISYDFLAESQDIFASWKNDY